MTNERISNPYVGPRTFTEAQQHLFFGREREASNLFARVLSERLVLFYAQSGAGKSSLINARLIPQLRNFGYAVLPVARVSGNLPDGVSAVDNIYLFNLMLGLANAGSVPDRFAQMDLAYFLAHLSSEDGKQYQYEESVEVQPTAPTPSAIPYLLIIDQFEELITTNLDHWEERADFFRQLNKAMADDPNLWVLLSFREDYVAPIEQYAPLMMDRMRARFYMERMGIVAAREAVRGPAAYGGRPFTDDALKQLLNDLSQIRIAGQEATVAGQYVEPVQLQVVCHQLWQNIEARPPGPITVDDLLNAGDVNQALSKFYDDVLASVLAFVPDPVSERRLRIWFEQELITPKGTRSLVAQSIGSLPPAIITELQRRFLIRADMRSGDTRIEIVHDRFIEPILASNRAWRTRNQNPLVLAAEVWLAENKNPRRLLADEQMRSAQAQFDAWRNELNADERSKVTALLEASASQEQQRARLLTAQQMALLEPQKYISEMGWGVIFPAYPSSDPDMAQKYERDEAIRAALQPLLDHRRAEATLHRPEYYREFTRGDGCRPQESAYDFLDRHKVGPGKVEPSLVPYYLLLVGDPETIPFEFQYQLDVQYAVGRIHFDTIEDYCRYAESVVQAETQATPRPRRLALFAPESEDDEDGKMVQSNLIQPLLRYLEAKRRDWSLTSVLADYATKARLQQVLGGDETPALAFLACHGMAFPPNDPHQLLHQGGLVCQDWPGPFRWRGALRKEFYFSADDLLAAANVLGLIAFVFAEYSAGTPRLDNFYRPEIQPEQAVIAERAFLAKLPKRLLTHRQGGALAFVGHVAVVSSFSFAWGKTGSGTGIHTYASVIERLLDGYPVGAALELFNQRYAELATILAETLKNVAQKDVEDSFTLNNLWTATIDARNWIIIGDPAVRLLVSGLRPDMADLELLYKVENLRRDGDRLAEAGNLSQAEAKYEEVLALNPWLGIDPTTEARTVAARTPLRKAQDLAKEGKIEAAVTLFEEAQRLNPALNIESMQAVQRLAAPYFLQKGREVAEAGNYQEALMLLERAAALDPILHVNPVAEARTRMARFHTTEGTRLAREGNVDDAIVHYEKASEFDPTLALDSKTEAGKNAALFFAAQGNALAEHGEYTQAVAAYEKAQTLDPSYAWDPQKKAAQMIAQHQEEKARTKQRRPQEDRLFWLNGVDVMTRQYSLPPMTGEELAAFIQAQKSPENLAELRYRYRKSTTRALSVKEGGDPTKLAEAGWGVIFAHDADPGIKEALQPLLDLRAAQAGVHFRCYEAGEGYRPHESKDKWLTRHGIGPGPADPEKVPYYLLIVGSPDKIPYRFQSELDVEYAVGRIHFTTLAEYEMYAQAVRRTEVEHPPARGLTMFSVINPDDRHTECIDEQLTTPLLKALRTRYPQWVEELRIGPHATKAALTELLRTSVPPSLLFCTGHGVTFPFDDPRRETQQGALLCADWPGPAQGSGPIPADFYFSANDLTPDMNLTGMIAFLWASYGGGTPQVDQFAEQAFGERMKFAERPFLAQLPVKMLGRPYGALAVVGLIDQAWTYSSSYEKPETAQRLTFENVLSRLFEGYPLGAALEYFSNRYAEFATVLSDEMEAIKFSDRRDDPYEIAGLWTANNDARNLMLIGDPAVRLMRRGTR